MTEQEQPQWAIAHITNVTHTPDGNVEEGHIHASDLDTAFAAAADMGATIYDRNENSKGGAGKSVSVGKKNWKSSWTPSGDVARANRSVTIAKETRGVPPNPNEN